MNILSLLETYIGQQCIATLELSQDLSEVSGSLCRGSGVVGGLQVTAGPERRERLRSDCLSSLHDNHQ